MLPREKKNLTMRLQFQRNIQRTLRAFEFKYMLSTTKKVKDNIKEITLKVK